MQGLYQSAAMRNFLDVIPKYVTATAVDPDYFSRIAEMIKQQTGMVSLGQELSQTMLRGMAWTDFSQSIMKNMAFPNFSQSLARLASQNVAAIAIPQIEAIQEEIDEDIDEEALLEFSTSESGAIQLSQVVSAITAEIDERVDPALRELIMWLVIVALMVGWKNAVSIFVAGVAVNRFQDNQRHNDPEK